MLKLVKVVVSFVQFLVSNVPVFCSWFEDLIHSNTIVLVMQGGLGIRVCELDTNMMLLDA